MDRLSEIRATSRELQGQGRSFLTALADALEGEALLVQGDLDGALAAGKKAGGQGWPVFFFGSGWHMLGHRLPYADLTARILAKKGDPAKAISEYERLLEPSGSMESMLFIHPLFHYRLGLLYEREGETAKAEAQYRRFLDLWKDADPGLPEVEDARKRLAGLKGS
jgi:tetratricopeptide (TPR) repeat protein